MPKEQIRLEIFEYIEIWYRKKEDIHFWIIIPLLSLIKNIKQLIIMPLNFL